MLTIGEIFPSYSVQGVVSNERSKAFETITEQSYTGKWKIYLFWPKDFTFVCPTEIAAFGRLNKEFADRDTQLLGCSVDNEYVHLAWRNNHADLKDLPSPMLADVRRDLCGQFGILDLCDSAAVTVMLDRLLHHGHVLKCGPRSWRTKTGSTGDAQ